jgi:hypothetical protein
LTCCATAWRREGVLEEELQGIIAKNCDSNIRYVAEYMTFVDMLRDSWAKHGVLQEELKASSPEMNR